MDFEFSQFLDTVKIHLINTSEKANQRRLQLYSDKIKCGKGCSGCCSRMQIISIAEAVIIYKYLCDRNEWDDVRLTSRGQLPLIQSINPIAWFKMNLKCPVLSIEDQSCRAYKVRPAICSTHFAVSDPSTCDPWSFDPNPYESLDFDDLYAEFQKSLMGQIDSYGILNLRLPIPAALLLAEKINTQSGLTLEQAAKLIYQEL